MMQFLEKGVSGFVLGTSALFGSANSWLKLDDNSLHQLIEDNFLSDDELKVVERCIEIRKDESNG